MQLTRLLGLFHTMDDTAQKLAAVQDLMLRYRHGLDFGEETVGPLGHSWSLSWPPAFAGRGLNLRLRRPTASLIPLRVL